MTHIDCGTYSVYEMGGRWTYTCYRCGPTWTRSVQTKWRAHRAAKAHWRNHHGL